VSVCREPGAGSVVARPKTRRSAPPDDVALAARDRIFAGSTAATVTGVAVLAVVLAVLLRESLFLGRGLVPADGVLRFPPWAPTWRVAPSNYLLADQYEVFVPLRQFFHDEILKGRLPLWNPHLGSGMPSLASMQGAALYPLNLLLSPIDPFVASGVAAFIKLLLAGTFTMMYMRCLGVVPGAALFAGLVYALSGFMIVWLGHPHVNGAILLPLLLYLIERQFNERLGLRCWIGVAIVFGVILLGGHPPTVVHITMAAVAYFVFRWAEPCRERRVTRMLMLAGALTAGVLVAAAQVLPYLEYYRESSSAVSSAALDRAGSRLAPHTLIHFFLPFLSGSPAAGFEHVPAALGLWSPSPNNNFNERTAYVGVLALFLAFVGAIRRRCRVGLFHAGLALVCLLIIYGVPPWPTVMRALPGLKDVNHQRLLLVVDWSLAVLAGLGLDTLARARARTQWRALAIAFTAAVILGLAALWSVIGSPFARLDGPARSFLMGQMGVLGAGLLVAILATLGRLPGRWVQAICVGWAALDLLWFATGYNPAISRERYHPPTESIRFLQSDPSTFRVLGLSAVLVPNTAQVYGLDDARGIDFTSLRRYEEMITGHAGNFWFYRLADRLPPPLDLLNVKYVLVPQRPTVPEGFELVYDKEIAILRYRHHRERALIVFEHRVESPETILQTVRSGGFDPERMLLLEEKPELPPGAVDPGISAAQVRIAKYEPDEVTVEAVTPRPGFLLLLDNYFPGWKAYVAEREVPLYRADFTFRAVALPAGRWTVRFVYRPVSFRAGAAISLTVVVALTVLWFGERRLCVNEP
jgi:hypothetical protein